LDHLKLSIAGLKSRIESCAGDFKAAEDLTAFAASRANDLRLTEPRLAKLDDFEADFNRLFSDLVEQHSTAALAIESPADMLPPELGNVFHRLEQADKLWHPGTISVPILKRKLEIPYAYKNGVVNLVKPHIFPGTKRAETQAATLAIDGDLIRKHPLGGERHQLVVVSTQETSKQAKEINDHVAPLFKEYGVRLIRLSDVGEFAREVEASAH
jgi:hypothetical protein